MEDIVKIFNLYFKDVYYFIFYLSKNKEIAEDVSSITFLKVIENIENFRNDSSIKTYIFKIAKNSYYTYIKINNKNLLLEDYDRNIKDKQNIEEEFIRLQEKTRLEKEIEKLKEPQKTIVSLRIYQEMSFKEIAKLYDKTDNWACVNFYRAKEILRERMADCE